MSETSLGVDLTVLGPQGDASWKGLAAGARLPLGLRPGQPTDAVAVFQNKEPFPVVVSAVRFDTPDQTALQVLDGVSVVGAPVTVAANGSGEVTVRFACKGTAGEGLAVAGTVVLISARA